LAALRRHSGARLVAASKFRPDLGEPDRAAAGTPLAPWHLAVAPRELQGMKLTPSSTAAPRPTVDEWGVYDPQQAGLAALYTRLTTPAAPQAKPAERVAARPERVAAGKPSSNR
jgi:hypothetical protein